MENLRNEPVYIAAAGTTPTQQPVVQPSYVAGGSGIGLGSIFELAIASSLFGGRGFAGGKDCNDNQICDLRRDVAKSESDVKESFNAAIHRNQIENAAHFSNLVDRSCSVEKEAIVGRFENTIESLKGSFGAQIEALKAGFAATLEAKETKADLLAAINTNTQFIRSDINNLHHEMDSKFCEQNHYLAKEFCATNANIDKQFCALNVDNERRAHHLEHIIVKGFENIAVRELSNENRELRDRLDKERDRNNDREIHEIQRVLGRLADKFACCDPCGGLLPTATRKASV